MKLKPPTDLQVRTVNTSQLSVTFQPSDRLRTFEVNCSDGNTVVKVINVTNILMLLLDMQLVEITNITSQLKICAKAHILFVFLGKGHNTMAVPNCLGNDAYSLCANL